MTVLLLLETKTSSSSSLVSDVSRFVSVVTGISLSGSVCIDFGFLENATLNDRLVALDPKAEDRRKLAVF